MKTVGKGAELRANSEIQAIGLGDVSTMHNFRVEIEKGALTAAPITQRELSYFEWSIITNPMEIDGDREYTSNDLLAPGPDSDIIPDSMENGDDEEQGSDRIDNIQENGRLLEEESHQPSQSINPMRPNTHVPPPGPLKGYEYTKFNPTPINPNSPGVNSYMCVSQADALAALEDLKKNLESTPRHWKRLQGSRD